MALQFNKDDKLKQNTGLDFVGEDGIYRIIIIENETKIDTFEGKNKGSKYHNLKIMFDNGKTKYIKIYYENAEGDTDPTGYNFLLTLRDALVEEYKEAEKNPNKVLNANSNQILGAYIKNKTPIYLAFRQNKFEGNTYFNLNKYINPMVTLNEAEEIADKRKLEVIDLDPEEKTKEPIDDWDEEDDL